MHSKQQKKYEETFMMIQCGDLALNFPINQAILLLGQTKAGKTTCGHYLSRQLLTGQLNQYEDLVYRNQYGGRYASAKIGAHQGTSETQIPNFFDASFIRSDLRLIDCPGYEDSQGCLRIISNGYFHFKTFSKIQKLKFVITVDYNHLQGLAQPLKNTFQSFCNGFQQISKIKSDVFNSCAVMITKVPINKDLQSIRRIWDKCGKKDNPLFEEFRKKIFEENRLFIMKVPSRLNEPVNINNDDLRKIDQKIKAFWIQKLDNQKKPILKDIQISISRRLLDQDEKSKQIQSFGEQFKQLILCKLNSFKSVLEALKFDAFGEQNSCSYFKIMQEFVNQYVLPKQNKNYKYKIYHEYEQKRNEVRQSMFQEDNIKQFSVSSQQSTPFWIKKIKLISKLSEINERLTLLDIYSEQINLFRLQITHQILKQIVNLCTSIQQRKIAIKFCYEIYRTVEISTNFYVIMSSKNNQSKMVDNNSSLLFILDEYPLGFKDIFDQLFSSKLIMCQINYLKDFKVDGKTYLQNYNKMSQVTFLFDQLINKLQILKIQDINVELQHMKEDEIDQIIIELKKKKLEIKMFYYGKFYQSLTKNTPNYITEVLKFIRNIDNLREEIQEVFNDLRLNAVDDHPIQMMRMKSISLLAESVYKINQQQNTALQLFDFIKNGYRIFEILERKIKDIQSNENKIKVYIVYIKIAERYHRKQLALEKAQQAYHLSQLIGDYTKTKQIHDMMKSLATNKSLSYKDPEVFADDFRVLEYPQHLRQKIQDLYQPLLNY